MKHYFGYRWSCLTKEICMSIALIIALLFFEQFHGITGIVAVTAIISYRLIIGAFPIQAVSIEQHLIIITKPWIFSPQVTIKTTDILDFTPMTINGLGKHIALGSNIVTESGTYSVFKNGILDYEKLHSLMTERFSKSSIKSIENNQSHSPLT